jgi:tRNA(fMet)-specific endonuclease VapC
MIKYMLDTDMCTYIIKQRPASVLQQFQKLTMDAIGISIATYAELIYGAERASSKRINRSVVENFVQHLEVMDWNREAADEYALIRTKLEASGTPIGAMDMMIAAHAKSLHAIVVTNNQKHFSKVKGLKIENWVETAK